jgi:catechol 2,3-dioxygenase-like lactoylglutathione lyase family enzyme
VAIRTVLINVTDVARSVDFYTRFLDVSVLSQTEDSALLDAVAGTIRLVRVAGETGSTWDGDDLQTGFRHVGFKVSDLDARVERLKSAGVPFHLDPIEAEGGVRITFFFDPDGTLLELVERALQYHEVYDRELVDADWALGDPERPRFDHIAETVEDLGATMAYFGQLGYTRMSGIHQAWDPRGFEIDFLRDGDSSLEIFTYAKAEKTRREPQLDAPGFLAVEFEGSLPADATPVGEAAGLRLVADPDGLVHTATEA